MTTNTAVDMETEQLISEIELLTSRALEETSQWNKHVVELNHEVTENSDNNNRNNITSNVTSNDNNNTSLALNNV